MLEYLLLFFFASASVLSFVLNAVLRILSRNIETTLPETMESEKSMVHYNKFDIAVLSLSDRRSLSGLTMCALHKPCILKQSCNEKHAGVERTQYKEHVPEQQPTGKEGVGTALTAEGAGLVRLNLALCSWHTLGVRLEGSNTVGGRTICQVRRMHRLAAACQSQGAKAFSKP